MVVVDVKGEQRKGQQKRGKRRKKDTQKRQETQEIHAREARAAYLSLLVAGGLVLLSHLLVLQTAQHPVHPKVTVKKG
jgi:hypothetical protein